MRLLSLCAVVLFPAFASAQSVEVFAATGIVRLWDDEGNLGAGAPIGGGVGFTSPHGFGIELIGDAQKAKRRFDSNVQFDSTVTAARVRILKYIGTGRTQPYLGGGFGLTRVESTRESPADCALANNVFTCAGRDIVRSTSTAGTLSGVVGVRINAAGVMFLRPEFELSKAGEHMRIGGTIAIGAAW